MARDRGFPAVTPGYSCFAPSGRGTRRKQLTGFSLVELLVIVAIITLLVGILLPSMGRATQIAKNNTTRSLLSTIEMGIEQFRSDTKDAFGLGMEYYPPSNQSDATAMFTEIGSTARVPDIDGRYLLTIFMTGYADDTDNDNAPSTDLSDDDGVDGWGMLMKGKRTFGPYSGLQNAPMSGDPGDPHAFLDAWDKEIYYYCYDGSKFDETDNSNDIPQAYLDYLEGSRRDFLLISPGSDGEFGDVSGGKPNSDAQDNITNTKSAM